MCHYHGLIFTLAWKIKLQLYKMSISWCKKIYFRFWICQPFKLWAYTYLLSLNQNHGRMFEYDFWWKSHLLISQVPSAQLVFHCVAYFNVYSMRGFLVVWSISWEALLNADLLGYYVYLAHCHAKNKFTW